MQSLLHAFVPPRLSRRNIFYTAAHNFSILSALIYSTSPKLSEVAFIVVLVKTT